MADEANTTTLENNNPPANGGGEGSANEPPAWFKEYQAQADKRFEGLSARLREVQPAKKPEPAPANGGAKAETPAPGVTESDLDASMRLQELRAQLDDEGRAELDELRADGLSLSHAVKVGEKMASRAANARASEPANGSPRGHAANASPSTAPRIPGNLSELKAMKEKDRKGYDALMARPDFDPSLLPRS